MIDEVLKDIKQFLSDMKRELPEVFADSRQLKLTTEPGQWKTAYAPLLAAVLSTAVHLIK